MAKPRVIISSDIGGADPDDFESMVHAFLAADRFEIEGLISTPSKHGGRASDIHKVIDAYGKDYANLKSWSSDYPTAAYLKSVVKQGSINVHSKGYGSPTEGSKHIIQKAHESSEPLWVLTWGSMTDLAQALHDDPSIANKIKVYSIGSWNTKQDPAARDYVYNNFKNLWWIENDSTFRGMYVNKDGAAANSFNMNDAKGHGALGDLFHQVRPWGIKMGDTPSLLRLIDSNRSNDSNPAAESWGGEFVKTGHGPNYWTDNPSSALKLGNFNGARTVYEDQAEIYKDMAKLFDRADKPNPNGSSKGGSSEKPAPVDPTPPPSAGSGSGKGGVDAANDQYVLAAGKTLWFNTRYLTHNDSGKGLKVVDLDDVSAAGVKVTWKADGTAVYKAPSGWQGTDTLNYTVQAGDGSKDIAQVSLKVGHGRDSTPSPADPAPSVPPSKGSSEGAVRAADNEYTLDAGKTLWFNARYLTWNDKDSNGKYGKDGGLKVVDIDDSTAAGVKVNMADNGTIVYRSEPGWEGTDSLTYTVRGKDGHTDTAKVFFKVGDGKSVLPPKGGKDDGDAPPSSGGSGNPVIVADDVRTTGKDQTLWFNTRHLLSNDKGADGGLDVIKLDSVSKAGVKVSWGPEGSKADGTTVYRPKPGWEGTDSLNYTVTDKDGSTDTGTVFIQVGSSDLLFV